MPHSTPNPHGTHVAGAPTEARVQCSLRLDKNGTGPRGHHACLAGSSRCRDAQFSSGCHNRTIPKSSNKPMNPDGQNEHAHTQRAGLTWANLRFMNESSSTMTPLLVTASSHWLLRIDFCSKRAAPRQASSPLSQPSRKGTRKKEEKKMIMLVSRPRAIRLSFVALFI